MFSPRLKISSDHSIEFHQKKEGGVWKTCVYLLPCINPRGEFPIGSAVKSIHLPVVNLHSIWLTGSVVTIVYLNLVFIVPSLILLRILSLVLPGPAGPFWKRSMFRPLYNVYQVYVKNREKEKDGLNQGPWATSLILTNSPQNFYIVFYN